MNPHPERPGARADAEVPRIGRYRVCYRIAQGGMASVYLARLEAASGFSKWVALKIIHPNIAAEPRFVEMFLDEARIAARLDHPNLCTVFDFGEDDGRYYLAMEYLHGETLGNVARRAWSAQGALPRELGVRLVADAARGLHYAHELKGDDGGNAHVVHRDVSPENVFVTYSGSAKVVDFGVARSDDQLHERTTTGELKGKLAYMSPEQLHERRVDRRTDVWALGVVLWEVTVGRRLFRRQTDAATVFAITRDPITPPSRLVADYPRDLEAIVMRSLERDLTKRYQTAQELCRALEAWLLTSGRPAGATEVGEFMQALFADQIAWRDRFLRQHDPAFRDLVSAWQSAPLRAASGDDPDVPGLDLGLPVPSAVARPEPAPAAVRPTPPDPPPRIPLLDDPDATARAPQTLPRDEAIPLTRRASIPEGRALVRRAATPLSVDDNAATRRLVAARSGATPPPPRRPAIPRETPPGLTPAPVERPSVPYVAPPRRSRWDVPFYLVGLMVLGGLFAHIAWFDKPTPRRPVSTAHRALTPAPAPPSPAVQAPTPPAPAASSPAAPDAAALATPDAATLATPDAAPARTRRHHQDAPAEDPGDTATDDRSVPGLLNVTATAPAEVFIGSRSLGHTPLAEVALSPGVYSVRVVSSEHAGAREFIVTVRPHRTSSLHAEWADERAMPLAPTPSARAPEP
ncbi:MAG: serine/threonine-protein kinase [Polyangiales bacterium]